MTEFQSPVSYAAHLAGYIRDPSTIRVRVLEDFGRAPTVDQCRNLIEARRREKARIEGYRISEYRFRALFRCGHPETEDNIVLCMDGIDRCRTCEERKVIQAKQRKEMRKLRERRERQEVQIAKALTSIIDQKPAYQARVMGDKLRAVAMYFDITVEDLVGKKRFDRLVDARCAFALLMKERNCSYPQIGRWLGGRDHSTVINLIRKAPARAARNPQILKALEELR